MLATELAASACRKRKLESTDEASAHLGEEPSTSQIKLDATTDAAPRVSVIPQQVWWLAGDPRLGGRVEWVRAVVLCWGDI